MIFWQTIAFWQGVSAGMILSIIVWICLFVTYNAGMKAATEKPEEEE